MMFCRKCGALIPDGSLFCRDCGESTESEGPMESQEKELEWDTPGLNEWVRMAEETAQDPPPSGAGADRSVREPAEHADAAIRDFHRIRNILPDSVIKAVLKKGDGASSSYHYVWIKENQCGWLWRATMRAVMPFQMKRGIGGSRSAGALNLVYWFLLSFIGWMMFGTPELTDWVFRLIWSIIILYALLPYGTALYCLVRNKNTYCRLVR